VSLGSLLPPFLACQGKRQERAPRITLTWRRSARPGASGRFATRPAIFRARPTARWPDRAGLHRRAVV